MDTDTVKTATTSQTVEAAHYLAWIAQRRSVGNLTTPAPTDAEIEQAIRCAMTAPDHKQLMPWRFHVFTADARKKLGEALVAAQLAQAAAENVDVSEEATVKTAQLPLRAPLIIAVCSHFNDHDKVPVHEQLLSAGAAMQNLLLAFMAMGYGTIWRSGPLANTTEVKQLLNASDEDYVVGFVYVGTSTVAMPERRTLNTAQYQSLVQHH